MNKKTVEELKTWFTSYAQTFKSGDTDQQRNIILKEEHTWGVCRDILDLGEKLELSEDDLRLAEVLGLFHDIGRFEQYAQYGTFVDGISVDHGEFGAKVLQETKVLDRLEKAEKDLILRAVNYHNRAYLPQEETERCLYFTKLLRDADKLDVLRVVTDYYQQMDEKSNGKSKRNSALELGLPNTPGISNEVYQDLMEGKLVALEHMKNLNDFKLLLAGWIYDINFQPTLKAIKERGYLKKIHGLISPSKEVDEIFEVLECSLEEKLANIR